MMKTGLFIAVAVVALGVTGCGSQKDENAQLKKQIDQLEQQVADLQKENTSADSQNSSSFSENLQPDNVQTDNPPSDNTTINNAPSENNASMTDTPAGPTHHEERASYDTGTTDASALAALIQDLERRINDTNPTGSAQEQTEQFYNLKGEIELAEKDLDALEDEMDAQRRAGNLSSTDYRDREKELDALDDQLDWCEDQLELLFGIDG